jgi:hypothetical protein
VEPLKTGQGLLEIDFFHANYPEGVQNKEYVLRVIHRASSHIAAVKMEDDQQPLVVVFPMATDWIKTHFPHFDSSKCSMER